MSALDAQAIDAAIEATWPAARIQRLGPWAIREGKGGGKRVSAASAEATFGAGDFVAAETAMLKLGQKPLFWIRETDGALNTALARRRYDRIDPVLLYAAACSDLVGPVPPVSTFLLDEPLAIMREIWAEGGIGPARIAVMDRVVTPKTMVLGRTDNRASGCAFAAIHEGIAMVHAVEVRAEARRKGTARHMMQTLAGWALSHGADAIAVAVTHANTAANHLYRALGMQIAGRYHYRIKTGDMP